MYGVVPALRVAPQEKLFGQPNHKLCFKLFSEPGRRSQLKIQKGPERFPLFGERLWASFFLSFSAGGDLLSHTLPGAVPSAQVGLASGFGKGPGVTPPLTTTDKPQSEQNTHPTKPRVRWCVVPFQTLHNKREYTLMRQSEIVLATTTNVVQCVEHRLISTGHLHHSHDFQIRPINPIIYREPQKKPHLRTGFPLRCFQRLSLPYVANQPCSWRNNWHTRGTSVPVLSY